MGAAIGNICTDGIQFDEPTVKHVVFSAEDLRALADWMDARKKQEGGEA